jgi:hypothetical protein
MANTIQAVVQVTKKPVRVSSNALSMAVVSSNPVTLKSMPLLVSHEGGAVELDQLSDVDISQEQDGSVLQYNASANNYQVKPLIIDGGVF